MFDTHRAVTALKEAGFEDDQAVALVSTIGDAMTGGLATKADIAQLRAESKSDIAGLRAEVKSDIADLRVDLYRQLWLLGIAIVTLNVTLTVALIKLLP